MTRSFIAVLVLGASTVALAPAFLEGCAQTGVGDPCVPEQEYDPTFAGFDPGEVNVESKSFDCLTRLCLANHFQGRVTCPYGQDVNGNPPKGNDSTGAAIAGCVVPGTTTPVVGQGGTPGKTVQPQCISRTADKALYCSCRCANEQGNTNDGANYCTCPEGYQCTQLVTSIGQGDTGLTGAYCMKSSTAYDTTSCPSVQLGQTVTAQNCDTSLAAGNGQCGPSNGGVF